jgi:predicted AAA+ superfamily ATPase
MAATHLDAMLTPYNPWWEAGTDYYREKNREVDFVLTHGGNRHLPFEV